MQLIKHFSDIAENDLMLVGGKALNLGKLTQAGFNVPPGCCVTTDVFSSSVKGLSEQTPENIIDLTLEPNIIEAIHTARETLNRGKVAVRSSATAEDLQDASFAGQQDTFLNVEDDELVGCIKRCWSSLWSERAINYRKTKGIQDDGLLMAVIVQEMCAADVSGVLFTVSPYDENVCIVESNWGLGESVVSGSITPDSFQISRKTGEILKKDIASKKEMITEVGVQGIPESKQNTQSLSDDQLMELYQIGLQVENLYDQPMDVEWALAGDKIVLLQARPITVKTQTIPQSDEEIQKLIQSEISTLERIADGRDTVWSHHNIAEVLPAPLPMTWEIIKDFMSGQGGLGKAYRSLGFHPSKHVDENGILDIICGRIYVNLNREAELFFDGFPLVHDFAELKQNPQKALYAQAKTDIKHSTLSFWVKLPQHIIRMTKAELQLNKCRSNYDKILREHELPNFHEMVRSEQHVSYTELSDRELVQKFSEWTQKTLDAFAPKALIATLLAAFSLQRLENILMKCMNENEAKGLASRLISGESGNLTIETNDKLWQVANEEMSLKDFLNDYGHRAVGEFELAEPRWREDTTYLKQIIQSYSQLKEKPTDTSESENQHFKRQREQRETALIELNKLLETHKKLKKQIEIELDYTRRYMPFRETAKFYLMLGYEQIRRTLIELDTRYKLEGGIFYLLPDELEGLINGERYNDLIVKRKEQRKKLIQIPLPDVIFSDALNGIGQHEQINASETFTGLGVSAGEAKGNARVLLSPSEINPTDKDYILVCPSTDPAWTPLFLKAAGLVMERGGMLSHGAVVAREYGVPAVVNIADATRAIADGQTLHVDGNQGTVSVISE
ncbi:hypothetical protein F4083_10360 [Candidatus Poribacteria bacterium]|nr:hypothetical protein [Candidatus Poribacteria bacterium]